MHFWQLSTRSWRRHGLFVWRQNTRIVLSICTYNWLILWDSRELGIV